MRLVVVIPTVGRIGAVERLLAHLESQSRLPDAVVISSPDASHIGTLKARSFPVTSVYGKRGLCAQRNQALDQRQGNFDLITVFDEDFIPADDYLERVEEQFEKAGRVSGYRLGYSHVANPFHLVRKGAMALPYALRLVARNVTANVVRSLWPEAYIDRRGRLRGNVLGTAHLLLGRLRPEAILEL